MSSAITRDHTLLSMTSPLGPDVLIPTRFTFEEVLGEPYLAVVDAVSARATIDPASLELLDGRRRAAQPRPGRGAVRGAVLIQ